jgi:hypothetical protein
MPKDRYVSFGEQVGAVPGLALAPDAVTATLRNSVWNRAAPLFRASNWDDPALVSANAFWIKMAWDKGWDVDEHRHDRADVCALVIKEWLLSQASWHEVYEFAQSFHRWANLSPTDRKTWEGEMDSAFFQGRSPYRFVNHTLTPISSESERASVAEAAAQKGKYALAAEHLSKALVKFGERPTPDYENAAKEAASAVESALEVATGKSSIADASREFGKAYGAHPALSDSASKLFGYASDRDGVRHGKTKSGKRLDFNEAKLVIVSASAWVSFIAAKAP